MKKSIKTLCVLLLGALTLASCEKETGDTVTLKTKISSYNGPGKLYVDNNHYTHWNEGDAVNINGTSRDVTFSGNTAQITDVSACSTYAAIFPYGIVTNESSVVYGATSVAVELPSSQNYSIDDTTGNQNIYAPMSAQVDTSTSGNTLQFTNLCSLVEVKVTAPAGVNLTLDRIDVTASSAYLSGPGTVNMNTGTLTMGSDPDQNCHTISLDFSDGVNLAAGDTGSYYVVVPPISGGNLTIDIYGHNGGNYYHYTKTKSNATLAASTIGPTPTLTAYTVAPWVGTGTESDPYQIGTLTQLQALSTNTNAGTTYSGVYFKLTADINCGDNWTPIGTYRYEFSGTFDGDGHSVTYQISAGGADYQGLFGYIENATVKNLIVSGSITGTGSEYGGVAGSTYFSTITNCYSSVSIGTSGGLCGGIAGIVLDASVISYCCASGTLTMNSTTGELHFGGIYGDGVSTTTSLPQIHNCTFTGAISPQPNSSYNGVGMIGGRRSNYLTGACYFLTSGYNNTVSWNGYKGIGTSEGGENTSNTIRVYSPQNTAAVGNEIMSVSEFLSAINNLGSQYKVYKDGVTSSLPQN